MTAIKLQPKVVYFAPGDVQVARVDRQCIVYACEAFQRCDVDVELVAMKIRLVSDETHADNPLQLYRLRTEPRLRLVNSWATQNSRPLWTSVNRLFVHEYAALKQWPETAGARSVTFYTKNYSSACLLLAIRRILMPGVQVVFEAHTLPHNRYQHAVLRRVDGIVANGFAVADDLRPLLPGKPMVPIHQGVDLEHYNSLRISKQEARRKLGLNDFSKSVVYTGKLYWGYREVELLIEASRHFAPGVELILVGGRADHARKYAEYVQQQGLNNIRVTGFVPPSEVHWYQLAADALVSYYPTGLELNRYRSPGKLFEYMAAGRAIVAADYASLREVIDESTAVFVEPDQPAKLGAAINDLLQNETRMHALSTAALQRVEHYTWQRRAQNILKFVESLS
jgi:glycosyltransferase involved in cell wall biosynthesis